MITFFKHDIVVNRSKDELLSFISASNVISCDRMNYGKKDEFRGSVWRNGFRIALNTYYVNSFASDAVGIVEQVGKDKCRVHLAVGMSEFVLVMMAVWNIGLFFALIVVLPSCFASGIAEGAATLLIFSPFILIDFLFIRFALYSNYLKLKKRMLEILT